MNNTSLASSSTPRPPTEGSQLQRELLDPDLYRAAVGGNVSILSRQDPNDPIALRGESWRGNTLLHIAAASSNDSPALWRHLSCRKSHRMFIREVYNRDNDLLMKHNMLMETPLHCAAKAGSTKTVKLLIKLAKSYSNDDVLIFRNFLKTRNVYGETALHEAVRVGHKEMVESLIDNWVGLMFVADNNGVYPLYLATMTNKLDVVRIFTCTKYPKQAQDVRCYGPRDQNALHASALDNTEITRELLKWDEELATKPDYSGSTPLHYAASVGNLQTVNVLLSCRKGKSTAYSQDENGLFPIHVAAQCGRTSVIERLMDEFPDSHELVDGRGRNFLHIAIESGKEQSIYSQFQLFHKKKIGDHKFSDSSKNHTLVNSRDNNGNTPLHLASENGDISFVRFLISCKKSCLSIMNRDGLTPLDLAMTKAEHGFMHRLNTQYNLLRLLMWAGAFPSPRRLDLVQEELGLPRYDTKIEITKAETVTRNLGIIAVLVATITFAATFAMPGGYIADTEPHKGSAVLSEKYLFKAFIVANTVAFVLSILATSWLIYAGSANVDFMLRMRCLVYSIQMVKIATKSTAAAFCFAVSAVLYQVNLLISILIFVFTFGVLLFGNPSYDTFLLALPTIWNRKGFRGLFKSVNPMTRIRVDMGIGHKYSYLFFGKVDVGVKQKFLSMIISRFIKNFILFSVIFLLPLSKI